MLDDRARLWVVKFQENPQHRRVLINDYLGTRICVLRRAVRRQIQERSRFDQLGEIEIVQSYLDEDTDTSVIQNLLLRVLSPREQEVLLLRLETMKSRDRGPFGNQHELGQNSIGSRTPKAKQCHHC